MRDVEIRTALHRRLRDEHAAEADTRYIDELGICGTVRVDLAVVNGTFAGYELKSDHDSAKRLPTQVEIYSKVLDRATLVLGERHHDRGAMVTMLPEWWGVIVASVRAGEPQLHEVRPSRWNDEIDVESLVRLLWRDEALEELEARGLDRGVRTKPRRDLADRMVQEVPVEELRAVVRLRLKTREGWRQPAPRG